MGNNQGYWTHEPILKYLAVHNRKIVHLNQPDYLSNKAFMNEYGSSSNLVVLLLL